MYSLLKIIKLKDRLAKTAINRDRELDLIATIIKAHYFII